jgi:15-cis-phytoene synthase
MLFLYQQVCEACSQLTTQQYSTSFTSAIQRLHRDLQTPIYNIYGFVRFADEIVDTFHEYDKAALLSDFKADTYKSIDQKISTNPILQSFQKTVNQFNIDLALVEAFFKSMEMDLQKDAYNQQEYNNYIFGSAEAVGLMCLHVFCEGNQAEYKMLKPSAQSLGAAFQKINFLRDIKADYQELNRTYFPEVDFEKFTVDEKRMIEQDIAKDFADALVGIKKLPWKARFGVYVAYKYYISLFYQIQKLPADKILSQRVRVSTIQKLRILLQSKLNHKLNQLS